MTHARFKSIAWLSLAAMLFSAVSPAIAATLLAEQPRALARMLGIPAAEETASNHAHAHPAQHPGHAPAADHPGHVPAPAQGPHTDHGIYCSLCLNASSTVAVVAAAGAAILVAPVRDMAAGETQQSFTPAFSPLFRSRAPPAH
jgi:hypothetical protein